MQEMHSHDIYVNVFGAVLVCLSRDDGPGHEEVGTDSCCDLRVRHSFTRN